MVKEGLVFGLGLAQRHAVRSQTAKGVSLALLVLLLWSVLVLLDVQDICRDEQRRMVLSSLWRALDT